MSSAILTLSLVQGAQQQGSTPTRDTLPILIAALGMPLGGGIVAILTFAIASLGKSEDDVRTAGTIPLLYASATALLVLVVNAISSAAIVAYGNPYDWNWARWSIGLLSFAMLTLALPMVRLLIVESRDSLSKNSIDAPLTRHLKRSYLTVSQLKGGMLALVGIAAVPSILVTILGSTSSGLTSACIITIPTLFAVTLTWVFFRETGYQQLHQRRLRRPGIIFLVTSSDQKLLFELQAENSAWDGRWTLPRYEVSEEDYEDYDAIARTVARDLMERLQAPQGEGIQDAFLNYQVEPRMAVSKRDFLGRYFLQRNVRAAASVSVFEIVRHPFQDYQNVNELRFDSRAVLPNNFRWWSVEEVLEFGPEEDGSNSASDALKRNAETARVPSHMKWLIQYIKQGQINEGWVPVESEYWHLEKPIRAFDIDPAQRATKKKRLDARRLHE